MKGQWKNGMKPVLILIAGLVVSAATGIQAGPYYSFFTVWERDVGVLHPVDLDGDGVDEVAGMVNDLQTDVRDWKLQTYYRSFPLRFQDPYYCIPLPTGRLDSLVFYLTVTKPDTLTAWIIPPKPDNPASLADQEDWILLDRFVRQAGTRPKHFDQSLGFIGFVRRPEAADLALFRLNCGFDPHGKRGIVAFDRITWKKAWTFLCGPQVLDVEIRDLNGDGADEILFGSYAPANGRNLNGTRDDSAYVFLIDARGRLLWRRGIGPYWTGVSVCAGDLTGQGGDDVAAFQYSLRELPDSQDRVLILDGETGAILRQKRIGDRLTCRPTTPLRFCRDLDGDGRDEIVLGNTDGYVRILDGQLTQTGVSPPFGKPVRVDLIADLNGDGAMEIVWSTDNEIGVMDRHLRPLTSKSSDMIDGADIMPLHAKGKTHIFLRKAPRAMLLSFRSSSMPFGPLRSRVSAFLWPAILVSWLILLGILYLLRGRILLSVLLPCLEKSRAADGLLITDRKKRILYMGSRWKTSFSLPFSGKGPVSRDDFLAALPEPVRPVVHGVSPRNEPEKTIRFQDGDGTDRFIRVIPIRIRAAGLTCFRLSDIKQEETQRLLYQWAHVAQRLAHGIKNPLTSLKLDTEDLCEMFLSDSPEEKKKALRLLESMPKRILRMLAMADGFMRYTGLRETGLTRCDLNAVIQENLLQWPPDPASGIQIEWEPAKTLPAVRLDPVQFVFAFENLLLNAFESIAGKGRILIQTHPAEVFDAEHGIQHWVELRIQDSGAGIPPEQIGRIREAFVTTKPNGTGLGLTIVDRVMETHGGCWEIQSQTGIGTTVMLRFRPANNLP
ncbi:MAG TPA: hypothetical protein ENN17_07795 [bacterium]|nr:hypothetical protein [bacterium]